MDEDFCFKHYRMGCEECENTAKERSVASEIRLLKEMVEDLQAQLRNAEARAESLQVQLSASMARTQAADSACAAAHARMRELEASNKLDAAHVTIDEIVKACGRGDVAIGRSSQELLEELRETKEAIKFFQTALVDVVHGKVLVKP